MVRNDIKNSSLLKTKFLIYAFNGRTVFLRKYSSFLHKNIRNIKGHFVFSLRATGNLPSTC